MSLKHRAKVFVSNWLGVIVAVLIMLVTGTLGFTYLQISSRLDNTLAFATQLITLKVPDGIARTVTIESPPGYVFHVIVQVGNETPTAAEVTLSNMKIVMDSVPIVITQNGPWTKTITETSGDGTGFENFEGDFTIGAQAFAGLVAKGTVDLDITLHVYASARYGLMTKHSAKDFDIHMPGIPFKYLTTP
jgi:hypothetical protein